MERRPRAEDDRRHGRECHVGLAVGKREGGRGEPRPGVVALRAFGADERGPRGGTLAAERLHENDQALHVTPEGMTGIE